MLTYNKCSLAHLRLAAPKAFPPALTENDVSYASTTVKNDVSYQYNSVKPRAPNTTLIKIQRSRMYPGAPFGYPGALEGALQKALQRLGSTRKSLCPATNFG